LNVFHWHVTDTHSFPIELTGAETAQLTQLGAYDSKSVYKTADVIDIVAYANFRGTYRSTP
jgi:hexosaminidase